MHLSLEQEAALKRVLSAMTDVLRDDEDKPMPVYEELRPDVELLQRRARTPQDRRTLEAALEHLANPNWDTPATGADAREMAAYAQRALDHQRWQIDVATLAAIYKAAEQAGYDTWYERFEEMMAVVVDRLKVDVDALNVALRGDVL